MFKPLHLLLERVIEAGTLTVETHDGAVCRFGNGHRPHISIRLADRRLERQLALNPNLVAGEAYMTGRLEMREGRIYDLIALVLENAERHPIPAWALFGDRLRYLARRASQFNPAWRSQRNVAHHYDLEDGIYDLFLDPERQYSCGYFQNDAVGLDQAQQAKIRHIAAKLNLDEHHRLLDIGSGWGGLALNLAAATGCTVDGITLSTAQLAYAQRWAAKQALEHRVKFDLVDYRKHQGRYDRIVSVGMFEHVGVNHFSSYFARIEDLLEDDGVALIHFIARADRPAATNGFIARHIFPGGYIPALSEVLPAVERSGLIVADIEILRLHYALTLRHWRERFLARWDEACAIRGEEFCRMWEFYLAGSEAAFRYQNLVVAQIQLTKRITTLPIVRDYIAHAETELVHAGSAQGTGARLRAAGE